VETPRRTRIYQNHHLDSTRWDAIAFRSGDVVITTSIKSGTTWMQRILSLLVFGPDPLPAPLSAISPWVDARLGGRPLDTAAIAAQEHQRFLKSHLPFDALPYDRKVRYIYVGRDTRDVFMSLWNHYSGYTQLMYQALDAADPESGPMPRCPATPRELWADWITRGSFEWEDDGWPFWSHHYHAGSYWPYRELPNLLLVHYADLLADLEGEMRRVAAFVGIEIADELWPQLIAKARFDAMKHDAPAWMPEAPRTFEGGTDRFFHKGTNGRWNDELTAEDLALYDTAAQRLDPKLRHWLEAGSTSSG
jgi:aryl sulfotransferase